MGAVVSCCCASPIRQSALPTKESSFEITCEALSPVISAPYYPPALNPMRRASFNPAPPLCLSPEHRLNSVESRLEHGSADPSRARLSSSHSSVGRLSDGKGSASASRSREETKAKLERVLSRGPNFTLRLDSKASRAASMSYPSGRRDSSVKFAELGSSPSEDEDHSHHEVKNASLLKKQRSGFMFDPDEDDEQKSRTASIFKQGLQEMKSLRSYRLRKHSRSFSDTDSRSHA